MNTCSLFKCLLTTAFLSYLVLAQGQGFTIQVAATITETEATSMLNSLNSMGIEAYLVIADVPGKGTRYRVRIGRFNTQAEARSVAEKARKKGQFKEFFIATYEAPTKVFVKAPISKPPEAATRANVANGANGTNERERANIETPGAAKETPLPLIEITDPVISKKSSVDKEINESDPFQVEIGNGHWRVVRRGSAAEKNLRSLFFVDALTGWAAGEGGAVYRTNDGGREWKQLATESDINIKQIHFVDWNYGWIIGDQGKDESGGSTVVLITANGGRSWSRQTLPSVECLFFTDLKTGWAAGRDATMLRTIDGGEHWSAIDEVEKLIGLPQESSSFTFGFREVFFLDKNNGWMIGNFYGRTQNNIGGLFVTTDGGQSWEPVKLTFPSQNSSGRFTPGLLHTVRFTDLQTGTLTGEMYDGESKFFFVLHTRDGGKTWEQFRTPSRAIQSAQFPDLSNGWIAAIAPREGGKIFDSTLMRTDNSGKSWENDLVTRGRRINNVFFLSSTRGWAVGDHGLILRYEKK
jgi:photosystem II stability/assembly factor-like uncharacterized protein